ncbi:MAG: nucleotidyl transferase AbiEii/AbiGii toxin family protein [Acidimicrobiaceae bacterium]|nr:nucleotidyl transferase AbiEii/AbiGii toxin family protein [Acidimicrobiaceae bacterium]
MLTPLQQRVRSIIAGLPEADAVALGGGGALIVHGIVDRATTDLDFFSPIDVDVRIFAEATCAALEQEGLGVATERSSPEFVRLLVNDGDELSIDIGISGRAFPPVPTPQGRVLAAEDLAGDKLLALFGRAEPRDFIDVYALMGRFDVTDLYRFASDKDQGFSLEHLRDALSVFDHHPRQAFPITDPEFETLRDWVHSWRNELPASPAPRRG